MYSTTSFRSGGSARPNLTATILMAWDKHVKRTANCSSPIFFTPDGTTTSARATRSVTMAQVAVVKNP
ncbi:hypothetical protein C5167_001545 [Papaver somniferum]|uniref:Uncharacterized protein n=1 Tax=Papaver somniferum TaxID=3469 RepID=A0A4Y7KVN4_PAPSO|nr:hypothetical protein C5167_001545 [Papaver somniferum]